MEPESRMEGPGLRAWAWGARECSVKRKTKLFPLALIFTSAPTPFSSQTSYFLVYHMEQVSIASCCWAEGSEYRSATKTTEDAGEK